MAINPIKLTQGASRLQIDAAQVATMRASGVLVEDPRRERPRYFDGRFLAARDLIRDQQYFLTREADLGRAAGSGVASGLFVDQGSTPNTLAVSAGQGVTPAGELVLLPEDLTINLADIAGAELLSARFGLGRVPVAPMRTRTGLFILALRPVEFTANRIGAYPTSLTGPRTSEDGDVIEATAVVLLPWQDDGGSDSLEARRGRAARAIFTGDGQVGLSTNVLPLAMLALQGNTLVWIDEAMVRRELGADRADLPGLGLAPRATRLAHLIQHQAHLADVVAQLRGRGFAAATQFPALPPAGPLPPDIIDTRDFTQRYFPSEVDVDFSIIPDDELPALVEEALALPPIDFQASEAALDLTAVLVLAPVPRAEFRAVLARLESRLRVLKPAAANLVAQRKPPEILRRLRLPQTLTLPDVANPSDAEWARLARLSTLWYVRRRNLAYRDDLAGTPVAVSGVNEVAVDRSVRERIATLGLTPALDRVLATSTPQAASRVIGLLAAPEVVASPALTAATLGALAARSGSSTPAAEVIATPRGRAAGAPAAATPAGPTLDSASVLTVAAELQYQGVGEGLRRIEQGAPARGLGRSALIAVASNDRWRALDAQARTAPAPELERLTRRLVDLRPPRPSAPAAPKAAAMPAEPAAEAATAPRGSGPAASARGAAAKTRAAKTAAPRKAAPRKSGAKAKGR